MIPDRHQKKAAAAALATLIAIPCEGLRRVAYYDPPSILTVCYGHTGRDIVKNRVYSLTECQGLLTTDMMKAVTAVDNCQPNLPPNVLAAFSDAAYNIGPTVACDRAHSSAARYLWQGRYIEACNALPSWDKAHVKGVLITLPGLTRRRLLERDICLKGIS